LQTTSTTTGNGNAVTDNAANDATIGGTVYKDLDLDGIRDLDDPPLAGVGVSLFSCLTGTRVFETISGDDGTYLLPISSSDATMEGEGDEGCYYVQFEVDGDYAYTSPINGETSDLSVTYYGNGRGMTNVDAGIAYTSTYPPTTDPASSRSGSVAATIAPTSAITASDNSPVYPTYSPTATNPPTPKETNEPTTESPTMSHMPSTTSPVTFDPTSSSPTSNPPTSAPTASDDERDDDGVDEPPPPQPTSLDATISVRMYDVTSAMEYSAQSIYVNVCGSFLNHQLKIATPPVYDLMCNVLGQESEGSSSSSSSSGRHRHRNTRADELIDESQRNSVIVETRVTGKSNGTSYASNDTTKFTDLLIGTFNVQGYLFLEELREEEWESDYFNDVGDVRGSYATDAAPSTDNDGDDDVKEVDGVEAIVRQLSHLHIGVIATAVSIFALFLCCCICRVRRRRTMNGDDDSEKATTGVVMGGGGRGGSRRSKSVPPLASADEAAVSDTVAFSPTFTNDGVEAGLLEVVTASSSSSSSPPPLIEPESIARGGDGMATRRDVLAPRGKLGVVVANAFRPNVSGAFRYGPAVHSLKDGSPMSGLLYEGDVIVAVNDVDTSEYTVERLSQLLIDTVGRERKISVLSSRR
jgi:hypothetical protein